MALKSWFISENSSLLESQTQLPNYDYKEEWESPESQFNENNQLEKERQNFSQEKYLALLFHLGMSMDQDEGEDMIKYLDILAEHKKTEIDALSQFKVIKDSTDPKQFTNSRDTNDDEYEKWLTSN